MRCHLLALPGWCRDQWDTRAGACVAASSGAWPACTSPPPPSWGRWTKHWIKWISNRMTYYIPIDEYNIYVYYIYNTYIYRVLLCVYTSWPILCNNLLYNWVKTFFRYKVGLRENNVKISSPMINLLSGGILDIWRTESPRSLITRQDLLDLQYVWSISIPSLAPPASASAIHHCCCGSSLLYKKGVYIVHFDYPPLSTPLVIFFYLQLTLRQEVNIFFPLPVQPHPLKIK